MPGACGRCLETFRDLLSVVIAITRSDRPVDAALIHGPTNGFQHGLEIFVQTADGVFSHIHIELLGSRFVLPCEVASAVSLGWRAVVNIRQIAIAGGCAL